MKVKDLIDKLLTLDPNLDLVCYSEDESLLVEGQNFKIMDIENIECIHAETLRDELRRPTLKIGKSEDSVKLAILNVISDF